MISLKKLLATVLSAAMVLGTMAIPAFADESESGNVAKIGDTEYATLQEAVDAAQNGDTVTLLNNSEGVGLTLSQKAPKNIVIDFNNYTYTVSNAVGSTTYETQAAHFEKGNTVTLKNGTLAAGTDPNLKLLIQNYCDLTLENMTLDGGDSLDYILSINHGNVVFNNVNIEKTGKITTIDVMHWENVKYTVGSETDIDYYKKSPTLKIYNSTNNIINGNFDIYCYDALTKKTDYTKDCIPNVEIYGGTFTADVSKYATANRTVMHNSDGTYTVSVAKIGNQGYSTLKDAVDAAKENETVTLLHDTEGDGIKVSSNRNFTIDFGGHTYKLDNPLVGSSKEYETNGFQLLKDSTIVMKNGSLYSEKANILIQNYSNLTLENMNLSLNRHHENKNQPLYTLSNNNGNIVLTGDTNISALERNIAFDVCRYASYPGVSVTMDENMTGKIDGNIELSGKKTANDFKLIIKNGTVNGKIINKATDVTVQITGGTFPEQDVTEYTADGYYYDTTDKTVKKSAAKVIDNAKSAGVKVTLDNLEKNSAIDKSTDATYNVVLDTVKSEDKAKVDEIKNANPNKTVIAYDIYVEKTENGIKSEVKDVRNQKVTLKLPTKVKESGVVKVYHNGSEISGVTLSEDRKSVSFIAQSFSTYTFVYDAANLTANDITKNIKVEFEQVTDSEYDIVLKATDPDTKINGLLTADLTFSLAQGEAWLIMKSLLRQI